MDCRRSHFETVQLLIEKVAKIKEKGDA